MSLQVPVSWGELVDKITILEIKMERIGAPDKRANVEAELTALIAVHDRQKPPPPALAALTEELRSVSWQLSYILPKHGKGKDDVLGYPRKN